MYIFLDDERNPWDVTWIQIPNEGYRIARNYAHFRDLLDIASNLKIEIEHVSFDHDLADQHYADACASKIDYSKYTEKTGFDCAKLLVEWCMDNKRPLPTFTVHSMNPVGKANIEGYLNNYKKFASK